MWLLLNKLHKQETLSFREGKGPESSPRLHEEGKFNLIFKEQKGLKQKEEELSQTWQWQEYKSEVEKYESKLGRCVENSGE